jgi:Ser-tRNA(Ala) deacylase AlaX
MATAEHFRTHRLEFTDQTVREWDAVVLASDPETGVVLDRSAFYPGGGGQPPDHGVLLWGGVQTRIVGARTGDDLYLIPAEGDPLPPAGTAVRIVDIVGLDTQADGGTHVASTRQIGRIEVAKVENKGRGFRRLRVRILD